ncbi:conjugative relaxase-like TrwC/TraI family protein [Nocardia tenerifensis]|uniref:Conjugative relaxase-like TrwC/TraI family protein n=1 Tax=Nocardia tenerifensis TaxID=228006 RepID=A0A318JRQ7_9NOCA|nr:MobF family relaxase [Nocardia tenerifensis]PXX52776.1 conjugative relaxase-like TrwC/TraI family protein [Nocardia tenerifensis]
MSLAKIASGDGYEYYLRSVATNDANDRGTQDLSGYYSERGESPGRWWGAGLTAVGIEAGEQVTEAQMRALIGHGLHPNAFAMIRAAKAEQLRLGAKPKDARRFAEQQARLGRPYGNYIPSEVSYRQQCADAYADYNSGRGLLDYAPIPEDERTRIRTEVAGAMFADEHGRAPRDDRELSGWVARASRPSMKAVAGYDLTFSPVKSVSALWALAPREISAAIEAAHHAAIGDALEYLQAHAVYTRVGRHSVRQVDVEGLLATVFDHRDSRAGDPDLHTHVVIANKVRRLDGQWGSLDGRMIYRHNVAASELYNTRLEHYLEQSLGLVFAEITPTGKRPIREIVGARTDLLRVWSKRAAAIEDKLTDLASQFQADHGREPTPNELLDLSQEATLRTRTGKPAARTHAEQRRDWRSDAVEVLGGEDAVHVMVTDMLNQQLPRRDTVTDAWIAATAARVVDTVAETRATWQEHHIRAETHRQLRGHVDPDHWHTLAARVISTALTPPHSIPRGTPERVPDAAALTRGDGTSVYTTAGSLLHTSPEIVAAETRLVEASLRTGGRTITAAAVDAALIEYAANHQGRTLNPAQQALVRDFAGSSARLQLVIAPAGTGKTTAMQTLTRAWTSEGGTVLAMSPLGSAAAHLGREIGTPGVTVDVLVTLADALATGALEPSRAPQWLQGIGPETLVIIDEIAKTPTLKLDSAVSWLLERGASVRAVGDDHQLASVAAGGVVRDIITAAGASTLTTVMRMADPGERAASLALREGDPAAIAYYTDHSRVQVGTLGTVAEQAFAAWDADRAAGLDTALLAPTRELVAGLNRRARTARLAREGLHGPQVELADGLSASAGDIIVTRRNNYRLRISATDHIRNGYRWHVEDVHADGRITATHLDSGRRVTMPADYVHAHVQLGYANTIDSSQGLTVDTCHGVLTGRESRAQLYVLATRARAGNYLYLATAGTGEESAAYTYTAVHAPTAVDMLTEILGRDGTQTSATTQARHDADPHQRLAHAVDAYLDALGVAVDHRISEQDQAALAAAAEQLVPGLTTEDAWPVLRQHLGLLALTGREPIQALTDAVNVRELDTAADRAAVLDWRIDPTGTHSTTVGPLRWLPDIPPVLRADAEFGEHLHARNREITDLVDAVTTTTRQWPTGTAPLWAQRLADTDPVLTAELAVWRAAHAIPDHDRRLTGPAQFPAAERREQHLLDERVAARLGDLDGDTRRWKHLGTDLEPRLLTDPYWPVLATEWTRAAAAGLDIPAAARDAVAARALPDEQPAAALRWRMSTDLDEHQADEQFAATVAELRAAQRLRKLSDNLLDIELSLRRSESRENHGLPSWLDHIGRSATSELDELHQQHQSLDEQAAAIRLAQAAAAHAKLIEEQTWQARRDLLARQQELNNTSKWRPRVRAAAQAEVNEARDELEPLEKRLTTAQFVAESAAKATGLTTYMWDHTLTTAADAHTRQSDLANAQYRVDSEARRQAQAQARADRQAARVQEVLDEQQRRSALTTEQRGLEDRARDEIYHQDNPAHEPITAAVKTTKRQTQTRDRTWHYPPLPDLGPSHDHGYGL